MTTSHLKPHEDALELGYPEHLFVYELEDEVPVMRTFTRWARKVKNQRLGYVDHARGRLHWTVYRKPGGEYVRATKHGLTRTRLWPDPDDAFVDLVKRLGHDDELERAALKRARERQEAARRRLDATIRWGDIARAAELRAEPRVDVLEDLDSAVYGETVLFVHKLLPRRGTFLRRQFEPDGEPASGTVTVAMFGEDGGKLHLAPGQVVGVEPAGGPREVA